MKANPSTENLLELCANLEALEESKTELNEFGKEMVKLADSLNQKFFIEAKAKLKQVQDKTGYDWSNYLSDQGISDFFENDFFDNIQHSLISDIEVEAKRFHD